MDWIAQTGAVVMFIPHYWNKTLIQEAVGQTQGLLIQGGSTPLTYQNGSMTEHQLAVEWALESAKRINKYREYPVWMTCLGYQSLVLDVTKDPNSLQQKQFENLNILLKVKI